MRLRACLGFMLLATGACATLPETIRIDVDGNRLEVKRKPDAPAPAPEAPTPEPAPEAPAPDAGRG